MFRFSLGDFFKFLNDKEIKEVKKMRCRSKNKKIELFRHIYLILPLFLFASSLTAGCGGGTETTGPSCGNGVAEAGEVCDGNDLRGESCQSLGFQEGTLVCMENCSGYDTTGCTDDQIPAAWSCDAGLYSDGNCDCGCGVLDPDCADGNAATCQNDHCPTDEVPVDGQNWLCESETTVPADWTCNPEMYGDGTCDCGCGVQDSDCADGSAAICESNNCPGDEIPVDGQNWLCETQPTVPEDWTCDEEWYGDGECDCGCGALDSDCADGSAGVCEYNNCPQDEVPVDGENWLCEPEGTVPADWSCNPNMYGDGTCDCGCGVLDSDCADSSAAVCQNDECPADEVPVDGENWSCGPEGTIPADWSCDPNMFDDGTCDCGCGALDSDCPDGSAAVCGNNNCPVDEVPTDGQNWLCEPEIIVPDEWTCDDSWYGDGDCDCGCGVQDIDCSDSSAGVCEYNHCPADEVPVDGQNWLCEPEITVPADWTCDDALYGDGFCDCGCGVQDSDCADGSAAVCQSDNCPADEVPVDGQNWLCEPEITVPADWTCNEAWYGDGECDCGCGVQDMDCPDGTADVCFYDVCPLGEEPKDGENWLCLPSDWSCDHDWYEDDEWCDCGCGVLDPDCADGSADVCDFDECPADEVPVDGQNWLCEPGPTVPADWTCNETWYGDGDCDCGCGVQDMDCPDGTADVCFYDDCPVGEEPKDGENWLCLPSDWSCDHDWYEDDEWCDCGCGVLDPDCPDGSLQVCEFDDCPTDEYPIDSENWLCHDGSIVPAEWYCDNSWYGDNMCDCGCGSMDPDCSDTSSGVCEYNDCPSGDPIDGENWLCQSNPDSCVGNCGGEASGGCWCDEFCFDNGDCCADICHPAACEDWFPTDC